MYIHVNNNYYYDKQWVLYGQLEKYNSVVLLLKTTRKQPVDIWVADDFDTWAKPCVDGCHFQFGEYVLELNIQLDGAGTFPHLLHFTMDTDINFKAMTCVTW